MKGIGYFQNLRKILRKFSDFFWKNFFGEIFWEDFFGRIFLGGFFGRNSEINMIFEYERN